MYIPKRYGQSKVDKCPFCSQEARTINSQSVPVCNNHKNSMLNEMKCSCGEILEMKKGKYGIFFTCLNCGNMNLRKVLEINEVKDVSQNDTSDKGTMIRKRPVFNNQETKPKEITIRSDDPDYFD